jgi:polyisoprenoid-binding protein YceI
MRPAAYFLALSFVTASLGQSTLAFGVATEPRSIDADRSKAQFTITHIFVDHVTGTVPITKGLLNVPEGSSIPASATAVFDATKLNTGDRDRDASLQSPDYFDAKRFPSWTFVSAKIVPSGPAAFGMDGMLTIHGVTQLEHLDVTVSGDASHPLYHATGHIDRRTFGMKGTRLDPVIGYVADVMLDIVLTPRDGHLGDAK